MNEKIEGKTCSGMKGILKEAEDMAKEDGEADVSDAGLVAAIQKAKHYEIAVYGTLRNWAMRLNKVGAAQSFQLAVDEEKQADMRLTRIAETSINGQAAEKDLAVGPEIRAR